MTYPEIVKRAFNLWWRTRSLWVLGVVAAIFGAGDYSAGSFNGNISSDSDLPPDVAENLGNNPLIQALVENPWPFVIGIILVAIVWTLISVAIGQIAQGAMIRMADVVDQGYAASLSDAFRVGLSRLGPLVLLAIVLALPIILIVLVMVAIIVLGAVQLNNQDLSGDPTAVLGAIGGALLCILPLALLIFVLGVVISLIGRIAQRAIVIEGVGPLASLGRAWGLIRRNLGNTLLNWLALGILGAIFGVVATLPALAIAIPAFFSFMSSGAIPWFAIVALFIYGLLVSVLVGGWLTSFNSTLWTLLYRSFVAREQAPIPESYAPGD